MQYLVVDNDTNIICGTISDLVNRYDNPKQTALDIVNSMNESLIKSGDKASFRVEEVSDKITYFFQKDNRELRTNNLEEAELVALMVDGEIIDTSPDSKVIPLRIRRA